MVQKVKKRLERNSRRSANRMVKKLKISDRTIRRLLKNDLKVKPYKIQKVHDLTPKQQPVRLERAEELLHLAESGQYLNIVFFEETIFEIEQFLNSQNDRQTDHSYENLSHRLTTWRQHPPQITVWAIVTADERSPIVFIEPGVKGNDKYYRESIL